MLVTNDLKHLIKMTKCLIRDIELHCADHLIELKYN